LAGGILVVAGASVALAQSSAPMTLTPEQVAAAQRMLATQGNGSVPPTTGTTATPTPTGQPQVTAPSVTSSTQTFQPATAPTSSAPLSRLEQLYSARAGRPLRQFGYDMFGVASPIPVTQVGAVQDNYVLGPGDIIDVIMRGHEVSEYRVTVDRDGRVILPNLEPVAAAGRTFGQVRQELADRIAKAFINTRAYISVATVRQISVMVSGEVNVPGMRTLSGLNTPIDALLLSGGVRKTGSLRNITVVRGGRSFRLDLYGVLAQGSAARVGNLTDGDRIIVPPLDGTVAIAGLVRRQGIYEFAGGAATADALVRLAGGVEIAGSYRLSKVQLEQNGTTRLVQITGGTPVRNGEILFVDQVADVALDRVTVQGAIKLPSTVPLGRSAKVSALIRGTSDLTPAAYTPFAVIVHRDPATNFRNLRGFSLQRAFDHTLDPTLTHDDTVYVFTVGEIRMLAAAAVSQMSRESAPMSGTIPNITSVTPGSQVSGPPPTPVSTPMPAGASAVGGPAPNGVPAPTSGAVDPRVAAVFGEETTSGTVALAQAQAVAAQDQYAPTAAETSGSTLITDQTPAKIAASLGVTQEALIRVARDYLVWVLGQVRDPGPYLAPGGTTLAEMMQAAGDVQLQADLSWVEVTSTEIDPLAGTSRTVRRAYKGQGADFARVSLRPLDVIRLRPVFSDRDEGRVVIAGQVRYPGSFDITRGERLSSVLDRAGGMTDEAYPYGAVFTRLSAAISEKEGNARAANELQSQAAALATQVPSPSAPPVNPANLAFLTNLAVTIRNAPVLGRIMVTADPAVLRLKPELDIVLEPGDTIYIPKRPSTVTVTGEVLNAGSFQQQGGLKLEEYLDMAGGATQNADESRIFVIFPDGSAQPARRGWFTFNNQMLPPGSTVVVPRDPRPFDTMAFLIAVTDITSKLAVTAASLAVIRNNN
jgi:protein involved in polysaccharide export with SLBB domain